MCAPMTPDVLELTDIMVRREHQSTGIGSALVGRMESWLDEHYRAVVVLNSDLYPAGSSGKRDATAFYTRLGYAVVATTGTTRVLWKQVAPPGAGACA